MPPPDLGFKPQYKIGDWLVDVQSNTLRNGTQEVSLEPRVMSLLAFLCQHQGQTLSKDILLQGVWGNTHYADSVVARAVSLIRQSLGDTPADSKYIQTIARRGYRLIVDVEQPVDARRNVSDTPGQEDHESASVRRQFRETNVEDTVAPLPVTPAVDRRMFDIFGKRLMLALVAVALSVTAFMFLIRTQDDHALEGQTRLSSERISTIAMMPFSIETAPESLRYLADSLQEDIVIQLSRHQTTQLIQLPATVTDGQKAGLALQASAVLSGSVDLSEQSITVHLVLQGLEDTEWYWKQSFTESIESIQQLRNRIVDALLVAGHPGEKHTESLAHGTRAVDPVAYQMYLEARWHSRQRSYAAMERGESLFRQLTISHPEFAAGHAGLALSYIVRVSYFNDDPDEGYARADVAATEALRLDPHGAYALTAKAQVLFHRDWDFDAAAAYLLQAIEASPGSIDARQYLAELYSATGQHALALTVIDDALERQPYSLLLMGVKGILLCGSGNYRATIEQMEKLERYGPSFNWQYRYWGYAYERLGEPVQAALARTIRDRSKMLDSERDAFVEQMHQTNGQAYWQWRESQQTDDPPRHTGIFFFSHAEMLALNGQLDEAMVWLEKTLQRRGQVFLLLRISPALDAIRERSDYQRLLALHGVPIHQPGEQLETIVETRSR